MNINFHCGCLIKPIKRALPIIEPISAIIPSKVKLYTHKIWSSKKGKTNSVQQNDTHCVFYQSKVPLNVAEMGQEGEDDQLFCPL